MAKRDDYDDSPGRALLLAFVAMVAVTALVAGSVGVAMLAAAKLGGIESGSAAAGTQADSPATLYMPSYKPTEDSGDGWNLPDPSATPPSLPGGSSTGSGSGTKQKQSGITLFVAPQQVSAGQRINFNGVYNGAEGATLQVQRREGGSWTDFPVTATVRGGSFETWIMTSRTGNSKFRVYDKSADKASNVVKIRIG